jgi:hypothetical protein
MTADFAFASNSVTTITIQGESAPPPPATLTHRYSFQGAAGSTIITDSVGGQNGTFSGSAGGLDGNGNLVLDGVNEYVNLGPNLIAGYTNVSVESWVSVSTSDATHARLFDFGDTDSSGNGDYGMDFVPVSGSSSWFEVFDIDPGYEDPQQILGTSLAGAGEVYVAVVYDPQLGYAAVYTNGILAASGAINIPFTSLVDAHDYIGKSGYNADPYLTATVSEFRVYRGDLSPAQVAEDYAAGPATLPPSHPILSISLSGNSLILSWSVYAAGYNVQMTTNLANGASWGPPPGASAPVPTNGVYQIVLPISGQTAFYRLVQ